MWRLFYSMLGLNPDSTLPVSHRNPWPEDIVCWTLDRGKEVKGEKLLLAGMYWLWGGGQVWWRVCRAAALCDCSGELRCETGLLQLSESMSITLWGAGPCRPDGDVEDQRRGEATPPPPTCRSSLFMLHTHTGEFIFIHTLYFYYIFLSFFNYNVYITIHNIIQGHNHRTAIVLK